MEPRQEQAWHRRPRAGPALLGALASLAAVAAAAALRWGPAAGGAWLSGGRGPAARAPRAPDGRGLLRMAGETSDGAPNSTARYRSAAELCSAAAPIPEVAPRAWRLGPAWRRACSERNREGAYPLGRNWCWVGMKRMCHWNLKSHLSWAKVQQKASDLGIAPPPSLQPYSPLRNPELCDDPSRGATVQFSESDFQQAREWFKDNVAVYVVSLPTSINRWEQIRARLEELQIWATRVPGVDMRVPSAILDAKRDGFVPRSYNFTRAQDAGYAWKHDMGSMIGTLGCAAAHFKVQQVAIADGSPMAVVLEDDSWPSDDFIPRLWKLVREELPCDWEVTALLSRCGFGSCVSPHLARVEPDVNEPEWRCRQGYSAPLLSPLVFLPLLLLVFLLLLLLLLIPPPS
ncbi:unnamed protein product [Prorocentrum cordatum]|uniref:Glycosyl transferase family 25 domain-containing protein n=1 Tax=Prorocentrum cordatum TaxID=2364126 RepID=A0ABN9R2A7_9DINO|nr:unnamed protein product [Polarella glacialis]